MTSTCGTNTLTLQAVSPGVSTAPDHKLAVATHASAGAASAATAALTAALSAGDEATVESFYRQYFGLLYQTAKRATGRDEALCLDIVQEAVLRVIRSVQQTDSEAAWIVWLRLVVRTTAYDLLRAELRRRRRETRVAESTKEASSETAAESCDATEDRDARLAWLREQISRLDPQLTRAIDLRYNHQWTLARVAEAMGLSIGTLDGKLRRTLDRLRRQARRDWEDDHD
jgi:RNA polymerase sigma-70 factor (ECF subfamily)